MVECHDQEAWEVGREVDDGDDIDKGGIWGGVEGSRWSVGEGVEVWVAFRAEVEVEDDASWGV